MASAWTSSAPAAAKGFQGVVKRHHFRGGRATHGSMFHRAPGSIGASSYPSRVVKGMRMAGHMGAGQVTVRNLKVLAWTPRRTCSWSRARCQAVPMPAWSTIAEGDRRQAGERRATGGAGPRRRAEEAMTVDVVNAQNEKIGSVELRDEVFGGRIKTDLIHESVVRANAAERRGTHATKTARWSAAVGKKPWRQKGTGAPASARFAIRCGARAAPCSVRSRAATSTTCRERSRRGRSAPRSPRSYATATVVVVDALSVARSRRKQRRRC